MTGAQITVGEYLLLRLKEIGVGHLSGISVCMAVSSFCAIVMPPTSLMLRNAAVPSPP